MQNKDFIVSCQALADEPLHSSFIMGKMALAAKMGGANGIRANGVDDIKAIKENVDLPIIGIVKRDYDDSDVYITPTMQEVDELVSVGVEVIALDATNRIRPNQLDLDTFVSEIKTKYPDVKLMADCSTYEEMYHAQALGFDYLGTTMFGYTPYSNHGAFSDIDEFLANTQDLTTPIIAEGQINTPEQAKEVMELDNVFAVVVGGAITRPQQITKRFVETIKG